MSKRLPPHANLEQLKKQAKDLLKASQSGDADACTRIEQFHPHRAASECTLQDAQLVIAREYSFESWTKLKHHLQKPLDNHETLIRRVAGFVGDRPEDCAMLLHTLLLSQEDDKVAIFLIALGQETTAHLLHHLENEEVEHIVAAINRHEVVTTSQEDAVFEEFERLLVAGKYVSRGGIDYARGALEKVMGERKAAAILKRINAQRQVVIDRLHNLLKDHLEDAIPILQHHPETTAVLLNGLDAETATRIQNHISDIEPDGALESKNELDLLQEFERFLIVKTYIFKGGIGYARGAIDKAFGPGMKDRIFNRIIEKQASGFLMANRAEPETVQSILADETPQHIALALSRLDNVQALRIFNQLPESLRAEIEMQFKTFNDAKSLDERVNSIRALRELDARFLDHLQ